MFADLGHFNRKAIQISFPFFVYIPLILAYLGQGASLILNPNVIENTFWLSIPDNKLIYSMMFILATLSTIIASQAMISATFSLVCHSRKLGCFPGVKVYLFVYLTYIREYDATNAYGMAVALVMFITTILMSIVIRVVWKFPIFVSIMFFLFFGFIDISFLSATLRKIPNGGWFPLLFATILTFIMCLWRFKWFKNVGSGFFSNTYPDDILQESVRLHKSSSKIFTSGTRDIDLNNERTDQAESSNNTRTTIILNEMVLHKIITDLQRKNIQICLSNIKIPLSHSSNINLFYYDDKKLDTSILVFSRMIKLSPSSIFITIRPEPISCVDYDDLLMGKEVGNYKGCCRVISRYGYMDKIAQCKEFPLKIIQI
ncbi:38781_t:CDS:2 [Gigaspora margarita]|uniref:38781_t:CDS:1 n=1 Tax=Gigaspora margarita TaxID=4874 RepID=A0ABM8VWL6_GIGMA|nr:38781_t:CDS:2 [Gigaspora margarita]